MTVLANLVTGLERTSVSGPFRAPVLRPARVADHYRPMHCQCNVLTTFNRSCRKHVGELDAEHRSASCVGAVVVRARYRAHQL